MYLFRPLLLRFPLTPPASHSVKWTEEVQQQVHVDGMATSNRGAALPCPALAVAPAPHPFLEFFSPLSRRSIMIVKMGLTVSKEVGEVHNSVRQRSQVNKIHLPSG